MIDTSENSKKTECTQKEKQAAYACGEWRNYADI